MRGRKPKPSALKKLAGNPGKRALNRNEPTPELKVPAAPKHLNKVARAEWKRVTAQLLILGMLGEIDMAALAAYCSAWADFVEASAHVNKKNGAVAYNAQGAPIRSPWMLIKKQAMDQVIAFSAQFGMTPSSRSRVNLPPDDSPEEKMASMLFRGRVKVGPAK